MMETKSWFWDRGLHTCAFPRLGQADTAALGQHYGQSCSTGKAGTEPSRGSLPTNTSIRATANSSWPKQVLPEAYWEPREGNASTDLTMSSMLCPER